MGGSGSKKITCEDIGYTGECFKMEEELVNLLDKYLRLPSVIWVGVREAGGMADKNKTSCSTVKKYEKWDKYQPKLLEIQDDLEHVLFQYFTTGEYVVYQYRPRVRMLYKMVTLIIEKIEKDPKIPFFCKKAKTNTNKKAIIQYEYERGKDQETENKLWKQMNSEGEVVNLVYRYDTYMFNFKEKKKFLHY